MSDTSMVRINTNTLLKDVNQLSTEIGTVKTSVKKMYNDVKMLGTMWKGRANMTFTNQFEQDCESIMEFLASLDKYVDMLEDDGNAYENCENKVINLAQSI